jgi:hypothetical protein
MQTPSSSPAIPASSTHRFPLREYWISAGRSITAEGIAVAERASNVLWGSALFLLLIAILPD